MGSIISFQPRIAQWIVVLFTLWADGIFIMGEQPHIYCRFEANKLNSCELFLGGRGFFGLVCFLFLLLLVFFF